MDDPPIIEATWEGKLDEVKRLVGKDPEMIQDFDGDDGWTSLHVSAYDDHVDIATFLLDMGARIDEQDNTFRRTALYLAAEEGHLSVVELLLARGADPDLANLFGRTPLMAASRCGSVDVVQCLLRQQQLPVMLDRCSGDGRSAIWWAVYGGYDKVLRVLLGAGADPAVGHDEEGKDAMATATIWGHLACTRLLEEWERSYTLNKARHLCDSTTNKISGPSSGDSQDHQSKIPRASEGQVLPAVQVVDNKGLVGSVLEYVLLGMKPELFEELMEVMGRTSSS